MLSSVSICSGIVSMVSTVFSMEWARFQASRSTDCFQPWRARKAAQREKKAIQGRVWASRKRTSGGSAACSPISRAQKPRGPQTARSSRRISSSVTASINRAPPGRGLRPVGRHQRHAVGVERAFEHDGVHLFEEVLQGDLEAVAEKMGRAADPGPPTVLLELPQHGEASAGAGSAAGARSVVEPEGRACEHLRQRGRLRGVARSPSRPRARKGGTLAPPTWS